MADRLDEPRMDPLLYDPDRTATDPLGLEFLTCDAGCIKFRLRSLTTDAIHTTYLADPFPAMLPWLESIAGGAKIAVWTICQEGSEARLIYSAVGDRFLGGGEDRLIYIGDGAVLFGLATAAVDRHALVSEIYEGFCRFTESDLYRPTEREPAMTLDEALRIAESLDDETDEYDLVGPWSGHCLRLLRSCKLASFIHDRQLEQSTFDLPWRGGVDGA